MVNIVILFISPGCMIWKSLFCWSTDCPQEPMCAILFYYIYIYKNVYQISNKSESSTELRVFLFFRGFNMLLFCKQVMEQLLFTGWVVHQTESYL